MHDDKILEDIDKAKEKYQNGEILEAYDILLGIVNNISNYTIEDALKEIRI